MKKYLVIFGLILAAVFAASFLRENNSESVARSGKSRWDKWTTRTTEAADEVVGTAKSVQAAPASSHAVAQVTAAETTYLQIQHEVASPTAYASYQASEADEYQENPGHMDAGMVKELKGFLTVEHRERNFLLKTVKVSEQKYREIREQRKQTDQMLRRAKEYAKRTGADLEELRAIILNKHVSWMESAIGYGYYQKLQEVSDPVASIDRQANNR